MREVGEPRTRASMLTELQERGEMERGLFFPSLAELMGLRRPEPVGDWKSGKLSKEKAELGRLAMTCDSD